MKQIRYREDADKNGFLFNKIIYVNLFNQWQTN
jgi:hypothetical protein